ncbi:MAG TPA: hypothetical protein VFQ22_07705 [Longimicrobiales bacterium]|nr:hypothetical protein [Longimicrobiales bacterium]
MPNDFAQAVAVADHERALGVEPLDELLADLDKTEAEWARGAALYGPGGTLDNLRKALLCTIALRIRDAKAEKGEKVTEAAIEQMAHADVGYREFLDQHTMARAEWLTLDAQRQAILMRINRGQALLRAASRFAA